MQQNKAQFAVGLAAQRKHSAEIHGNNKGLLADAGAVFEDVIDYVHDIDEIYLAVAVDITAEKRARGRGEVEYIKDQTDGIADIEGTLAIAITGQIIEFAETNIYPWSVQRKYGTWFRTGVN